MRTKLRPTARALPSQATGTVRLLLLTALVSGSIAQTSGANNTIGLRLSVGFSSLQPSIVSLITCSSLVALVTVLDCPQSLPLLNNVQLALLPVSGSGNRSPAYASRLLSADCSSLSFACPRARPGAYVPQLIQSNEFSASGAHSILAASAQVLSIVDPPVAGFCGQALNISYSAVYATLSVQLSAPAVLPASVSLRLLDAEFNISPAFLTWTQGQSGPKQFTVQLLRISSPNLQAVLQAEANVRISVDLAWADLDLPLPSFRFLPDQVVAVRDADGFSSLQIPIARNSPNAMPSVLSFSTYALDVQGCQNPDLCASAVLTNGTVQFQPFTDNGYAVVGVWWDRLPATAALRVGLRLHAQENAVIERQEGAVALMVYGVEAGQCPVGTTGPAIGHATALSAPTAAGALASSSVCQGDAAAAFLDSMAAQFNGSMPLMIACLDGHYALQPSALDDPAAEYLTAGNTGNDAHTPVFPLRRPALANTTYVFVPLEAASGSLRLVSSSCGGLSSWQLYPSSIGVGVAWYYAAIQPQAAPCTVSIMLREVVSQADPAGVLGGGGGNSGPVSSVGGDGSTASGGQSGDPAHRHRTRRQLRSDATSSAMPNISAAANSVTATATPSVAPVPANATAIADTVAVTTQSPTPAAGLSRNNTSTTTTTSAINTSTSIIAASGSTVGPRLGLSSRAAIDRPASMRSSVVQERQVMLLILPTSPLSVLRTASMYFTNASTVAGISNGATSSSSAYWPLCSLPDELLQLAQGCARTTRRSLSITATPLPTGGSSSKSMVVTSDVPMDPSTARALLVRAVLGSRNAIAALGAMPADSSSAPATSNGGAAIVDTQGSGIKVQQPETLTAFVLAGCDSSNSSSGNTSATTGSAASTGTASRALVYVNPQFLDACDPHQPLMLDVSTLKHAMAMSLLASSSGVQLASRPAQARLDPTQPEALLGQYVARSSSAGSGGKEASRAGAVFVPQQGAAPVAALPVNCASLLQADYIMPLTLLAPDGVSSRGYTLHAFNDYGQAAAAALRCSSMRQQQQAVAATAAPPPGATARSSHAANAGSDSTAGSTITDGGGSSSSMTPSVFAGLCSPCMPGSFSPAVNTETCSLCPPGSFTDRSQRATCSPCTAGYSTFAFGSTSCRACLMGTYSAFSGAVACQVCPMGQSTMLEGSSGCAAPLSSLGTGMGTAGGRQLVWQISFQLALNMTREAINGLSARNTGINATGPSIIQLAVRADTASALNIPYANVQVAHVQQEDPSMFLVNVTATVPIAAPESGSGNAGSAGSRAPEKNVDADKLIERLVGDPPSAFPRTFEITGTRPKISNVHQQMITLSPDDYQPNLHAILWPTLIGSLALGALLGCAWRRWGRCKRRGGQGAQPCMDGLVGTRWEAAGLGSSGKEATSPAPSPTLVSMASGGSLGLELSEAAAYGGGSGVAHQPHGFAATRHRSRGHRSGSSGSDVLAMQLATQGGYDVAALQIQYAREAAMGPKL